MRGISWLAERTLSFLRRTLLHGVSYYLLRAYIQLKVCVCVCVYVCMYVCMYVCARVCVRMLTSSSRTDKPICTKLGMLISWDQEENIERSKLRKCVLNSSPDESGSCSSESKDDKRTAPGPKPFDSASRLQNQRLQPHFPAATLWALP
jgi:hypothetical protein